MDNEEFTDSDKENDEGMSSDRKERTHTMMGIKRNTKKQGGAGGAGGAKGDHHLALLQSASEDRGAMLTLMNERNAMFRSWMENKTLIKHISLAARGTGEFGVCVQLKDLDQVKTEACDHIGVDQNQTVISGILRKYRDCPASMPGAGQKITSVHQLDTDKEVFVDTFVSSDGRNYLRFSDFIIDDTRDIDG